MHRSLYGLLAIGIAIHSSAQNVTIADLQGTWFLHQQYIDSVPVFDADDEASFAPPTLDQLRRLAAMEPGRIDSTAVLASIHQDFENLRHYAIRFSADSTYQTDFTPGMAKPLPAPEKGRFELTPGPNSLRLYDATGSSTTGFVKLRDKEIVLLFEGIPGRLVFRREQP